MTVIHRPALISEEEYLSSPAYEDWRYEYVGGKVVAMAEPSDRHEIISGNVFGALHQHLRKHPCQVFHGNKRVRTGFLNRAFHYYPDVMVICQTEQPDPRFKEGPSLVVEVLSPTTENTDIREKMFAYLNTASVQHYVIVAQDKVEITIYRRVSAPENWEVEVLNEGGDILRLPDMAFQMSASDVYERSGVMGGAATADDLPV